MSLFSVSINVLITCGETNGRLTWCFVCSRLLQSLLLLRLCLNAHSRGATDDVTAIASPDPETLSQLIMELIVLLTRLISTLLSL